MVHMVSEQTATVQNRTPNGTRIVALTASEDRATAKASAVTGERERRLDHHAMADEARPRGLPRERPDGFDGTRAR